MDHRSTAPSLGQEFHPFQFRGSFLPAYLHGLMAGGQLTATDVGVFAIVDAVSKGEEGCFATNGYLAASCGVEKRTVIRSVARLVRLGVLTAEVRGRNRRTLRVVPNVFTRSAERSDDDSRSDSGVRGGVTRVSLHKKQNKKKQTHITSRVPVSAPPGSNRRRPAVTGDAPTTDGSGTLPRPPEDSTVLIEMGTPSDAKTKPTPSDVAHANRLHEIITTKARIGVPWSRSRWADYIRKLRNDLGGDAARIGRALDFLAKHYDDKYCPKPSCAQKFREKFTKVEEAIFRFKEQEPVTITPAATKIADRLQREYDWPNGSAPHLEGAVQRSLDNFNKFAADVTALEKKLKPRAETDRKARLLLRYTRRLFTEAFLYPESTVREWFEEIHAKLKDCERWGGRFDNYIWSPQHKDVIRAGKRVTDNGDAAWDELMEALK